MGVGNVVREIVRKYRTLSPEVGSPPSSAFLLWVFKHTVRFTVYEEFMVWVFGGQWYHYTCLAAGTFVDIGTVNANVLEALMKGLLSGQVYFILLF